MDAVEEIKHRLALEDVVGEYMELKRAGRNLKGMSPFNSEKTASFMVSPEKQIWHDFSSGKGGNVFSFIMEIEGMDFKSALEHLARKAGVELSNYRSGANNNEAKQQLYEVIEIATKFYQVQFSKNKTALEYVLKTRQFTKETALKFRIGYSPDNYTGLRDYLNKKGFDDKLLKQAGLISIYSNRATDMFRGRLMIPLMDGFGKVIGFTARILTDDKEAPKYINTPQTMLYDKGRHVFGLDLAKEAIRKSNFVVVVEGNLDVIASNQAGITQVVATAGTAVTEQQLKALGRFTDDVRLAFDQDSAGLNATERVIPIASKAKLNLSIISIPAGKDPDELIRKDKNLWLDIISKNQYAIDWLIERKRDQFDLKSAEGKRKFSDSMMSTINQLKDPVEKEHYIKQLSQLIDVSVDSLDQKLVSAEPQKRYKPTKIDKSQLVKQQMDLLKYQDRFMTLIYTNSPLRFMLKDIRPEMLVTDEARTLLKIIDKEPGLQDTEPLDAKLKPVEDYVKIMKLQFEELYYGLELLELRNEATRLKGRIIEHYVMQRKTKISALLDQADEAETKLLLTEATQLDQLRRNIK